MARKPIDLRAVRDARERLRAIAREHPELTGPSGQGNRVGWEAVLEEDEMVAAKMAAFRLPEELLNRLDAYAGRMAKETGINVTRADVVKQLLTRGLDAIDQGRTSKRKK